MYQKPCFDNVRTSLVTRLTKLTVSKGVQVLQVLEILLDMKLYLLNNATALFISLIMM